MILLQPRESEVHKFISQTCESLRTAAREVVDVVAARTAMLARTEAALVHVNLAQLADVALGTRTQVAVATHHAHTAIHTRGGLTGVHPLPADCCRLLQVCCPVCVACQQLHFVFRGDSAGWSCPRG